MTCRSSGDCEPPPVATMLVGCGMPSAAAGCAEGENDALESSHWSWRLLRCSGLDWSRKQNAGWRTGCLGGGGQDVKGFGVR